MELLGGVRVEWHAGLVGHASGSQTPGNYVIHIGGPGQTVDYVSYDTFLRDRNGNRRTFMGQYYQPVGDNFVYYDIFYTVHDLTNLRIGYTAAPVMSTTTSSGTIHPQTITRMRCDAVVEYCYEYNGVRLLGPEGAWNISTALGLTIILFLTALQCRQV
ncbi:hypothetical protein CACET_c07090 [Clostridium aceticum]|uniref:Uncharacterized protein n=1 Tax=Clostridium aceticum TaxID=84022 RepID=A0A0D8IEE8_9CLOT|nr:hypothetical protein [Clostridium aceticum]AKL94219.1 hypothetical protein CACET_c07090 [Clostridium aceticum]KJF28444.1 hypothetical protein TZ02_00480 [Clostridium aceticum]